MGCEQRQHTALPESTSGVSSARAAWSLAPRCLVSVMRWASCSGWAGCVVGHALLGPLRGHGLLPEWLPLPPGSPDPGAFPARCPVEPNTPGRLTESEPAVLAAGAADQAGSQLSPRPVHEGELRVVICWWSSEWRRDRALLRAAQTVATSWARDRRTLRTRQACQERPRSGAASAGVWARTMASSAAVHGSYWRWAAGMLSRLRRRS